MRLLFGWFCILALVLWVFFVLLIFFISVRPEFVVCGIALSVYIQQYRSLLCCVLLVVFHLLFDIFYEHRKPFSLAVSLLRCVVFLRCYILYIYFYIHVHIFNRHAECD